MSITFDRLHLPLALAVIAAGMLLAIALPFDPDDGQAAAAVADPSGTWLVEDGEARIRIAPCPRPADRICGYLVWAKAGGADRDESNPDRALRDRPLLGMQVLLGLEDDGSSWSGRIYDAQNGKSYDAHVTRLDAKRLALKGCLLRYLCKSQTWTRVDDVVPGELTGPVDAPGGPRSDAAYAAVAPARKTRR